MNRRMGPGTAVSTLLLVLFLAVAAARCTTGPTPPGNPGSFPTNTPRQVNFGGGSSSGGTGSQGSLQRGLGNNTASNPGGGLPNLATKPPVPRTTYQGCPAQGDGGDPELNTRKNRTDTAAWYPVSISSLLNLGWPQGIERKPHASWSATDAAQVAKYEGIPIQVEGWLAGAKAEGPESCNCHSPDDVDNHLWIVDDPSKDRSQSVVVEITPRVRAMHPGWAFDRIRPLVDGKTKVRISGWLLMDPEHPDQVGKTRGTIWELHPIIAFDVQKGGQWVELDTGKAAPANQAQQAPPTEDPSLPPLVFDTPEPGVPTATPRPQAPQSGGQGTSSGAVHISDIFYNGTKGSTEPDEYVEITNSGSDPVNMDGWTLQDVYGGQQFTWQGFTIQPGQKIRVYTNEVHNESGGFSFGSGNAIWANKGDAAELLDASGDVVSTFAYGNRR